MQVLTGLLAVVGGVPQWLGKLFKESPPLKWAALALVLGAVVTITIKEGAEVYRVVMTTGLQVEQINAESCEKRYKSLLDQSTVGEIERGQHTAPEYKKWEKECRGYLGGSRYNPLEAAASNDAPEKFATADEARAALLASKEACKNGYSPEIKADERQACVTALETALAKWNQHARWWNLKGIDAAPDWPWNIPKGLGLLAALILFVQFITMGASWIVAKVRGK